MGPELYRRHQCGAGCTPHFLKAGAWLTLKPSEAIGPCLVPRSQGQAKSQACQTWVREICPPRTNAGDWHVPETESTGTEGDQEPYFQAASPQQRHRLCGRCCMRMRGSYLLWTKKKRHRHQLGQCLGPKAITTVYSVSFCVLFLFFRAGNEPTRQAIYHRAIPLAFH